MRCEDVAELLLARDREPDSELEKHLTGCQACEQLARNLERVDSVLATSLLVEPPLELQRQLAQLAVEAARPQPAPWWSRLLRGELSVGDWFVLRPNVAAAQGLAAVMLALAGWQVFGWLSAFRPVVGDVAYAMQLVAASPAVVYLGGFQFDLQNLGLWSVVGLGGWLLSENGILGKRLSALTSRFNLRLP